MTQTRNLHQRYQSGPLGATTEALTLRVDEVSCAMFVCDLAGCVIALSPAARALLSDAGIHCGDLPCPLPESLWQVVASVPPGISVEWRPSDSAHRCLGVTRHHVADRGFLLLMREITDAQKELAQRLQRQRLESIGRLVAAIAHDLRAPLANIMFGANVLAERCEELGVEQIREKLEQIIGAAARQQATIAGLLDFARIGPPVKSDIALAETFERVTALLRSMVRDGSHRIVTDIGGGSKTVYCNQLSLEQILVNLVVNALEAAPRPVTVELRSRQSRTDDMVEIHVVDDGDGITDSVRQRLFEPFFTTKPQGTGLGLATAREAAIDQGGGITVLPAAKGAHFVVTLPNTKTGTTRDFYVPIDAIEQSRK